MKIKLFHRIGVVMIFALAMLVFSQVIWLQQQIEQEKQAFRLTLENSLESMLNFHALQGYIIPDPQKPNTTTIVIEVTTTEEIDKDTTHQLGRYEISTKKYTANLSLHKVLEAAYSDISLAKKKIQLKVIDSLFRNNFTELEYIKFYDMQLSENDVMIDALYQTKNAIPKNAANTIHISIPLGTKGVYVFTANFQLQIIPFLRLMFYSLSISVLAIILVSFFMLWLLLKLQQKAKQVQWREQAVSGVVHDLKSPISFTYTFLDYLSSKEELAPMQSLLSNASANISKLNGKIELILTLFRGKHQKIVMKAENYPLALKCKEILSELNVIYQEKQAKFDVNISQDLNLMVDPLYFEMALRNLIDNAFKYSDTPAKIDISTKTDKKKFHIYIKDSGNGIPKNEQKKIFSEFYRSDNITKGHGIGLSFSKKVIKAHKGKISLQSKIDEGSTFCIELPIKIIKKITKIQYSRHN
ncbi:sensor histidine kinase [Marinifilum sp. D737]|uniref:sensor histidine kinase n=1 Tax=Marinifilum sp. D737 TaxID=2969628 RepID=UPI002275E43C|nr:HAMP domain-containing sensor histidine kinase [Marinifilum sp. D737]MCY1633355.1 HAMP domain-containing histidine kinase [Marinifilum sp. D737]